MFKTAAQVKAEAQATLMASYQSAIEGHVNAVARQRNYRDAVSLASYYNSTVEPWSSEAQAFVTWRDQVWQYAFAELDKVQSGEREQPTVEAFVAEISENVKIKWPKEQ